MFVSLHLFDVVLLYGYGVRIIFLFSSSQWNLLLWKFVEKRFPPLCFTNISSAFLYLPQPLLHAILFYIPRYIELCPLIEILNTWRLRGDRTRQMSWCKVYADYFNSWIKTNIYEVLLFAKTLASKVYHLGKFKHMLFVCVIYCVEHF